MLLGALRRGVQLTRAPALTLSLVAALLAGCQAPETRPRAMRSAIIDGERSPSGPEDGVLFLETQGGPYGLVQCTAALVAPNLVLTARHCTAPMIDGNILCNNRGELISKDDSGRFDPELPPEAAALHFRPFDNRVLAVGKRIFSTNPVSVCANDIALIELDREVDLPVVPLRRAPARVEEVVTLVGFGLTSADSGLSRQRLRRSSTIGAVGPDSLAQGEGKTPPRVFTIPGTLGCPGDSGGPAIAEDGAVIGVYSLQLGRNCEDASAVNYFTHVPPFEALITKAFEAAGATPVYSDEGVEPEPSAEPSEPEPEPEPSEPEPEPSEPEPEPSEPEPTEPEPSEPEPEPSEPGANSDGCTFRASPIERVSPWPFAVVFLGLTRRRRRPSVSTGSAELERHHGSYAITELQSRPSKG